MKNLTYRIIGFASGLAIVFAAFLPWHGPIQRVNELFGLTVYSTDELFEFDFMTIIGGVLYLPFLAVAHKGRLWRALGAVAAGASLFVAGYSYLRFFRADHLVGLNLTLVASALALTMILLMKEEGRSISA